MHAYLVWSDYGDDEEWTDQADIVFANTRGVARSLFTWRHCLDFIDPIHIHIIAKNIDCNYDGFAEPDDPLWQMVGGDA